MSSTDTVARVQVHWDLQEQSCRAEDRTESPHERHDGRTYETQSVWPQRPVRHGRWWWHGRRHGRQWQHRHGHEQHVRRHGLRARKRSWKRKRYVYFFRVANIERDAGLIFRFMLNNLQTYHCWLCSNVFSEYKCWKAVVFPCPVMPSNLLQFVRWSSITGRSVAL